ncbi:MAG TPA: hypothetical protein VMF14_17245 [Solirubrobacteraceae bacterium]|nr:hypothetical protein [Solirubrobacteraceae bacterium]
MNLNRDEFLLLARTGRGSYSTRAGPGPDERFEAGMTSRRLRRRRRSGLLLRPGMGRGMRHVLGPRSERSPRLSRTLEHAGDEYFELEFAVGFPAEEETLL